MSIKSQFFIPICIPKFVNVDQLIYLFKYPILLQKLSPLQKAVLH